MYIRFPANFGEPAPISFPNIRAKRPDLYNAALRAQGAVDNLRWFKDVYFPLAQAAANARLVLNNADQVIVIPEEKSVENLLGPNLIQAALKQSGKSLAKHLVGDDFGRVLGILDFLLKLKTALELEDGRRLVSEQNRSRRDDAYRYKLRFFIRLWIAQKAPGADSVILAGRMEKAFWEYQNALGELWKYQDIEEEPGARDVSVPAPPSSVPPGTTRALGDAGVGL